MNEENAKLQTLMNTLLPQGKSLRILEAGCGSTSHLHLPENAWLVGIDISLQQLERHTCLNEKVLGNLQTHEWQSGEFDLIVCWDVLEHLPDPAEAMNRMFAALRDGGLVVLALPNRNSLKGLITRLTPFAIHAWFYRYIIGDKRPRNRLDQFPTCFRAEVSPTRIRARATAAGLTTLYYHLYEGPVQSFMRQRNRLVDLAFGTLSTLSKLLTLGCYNPNHSDFFIVLHKQGNSS